MINRIVSVFYQIKVSLHSVKDFRDKYCISALRQLCSLFSRAEITIIF